jgi:hypothetical protein
MTGRRNNPTTFSPALMDTKSIMNYVMWSFFAIEYGGMAVQTLVQTQVVALSLMVTTMSSLLALKATSFPMA